MITLLSIRINDRKQNVQSCPHDRDQNVQTCIKHDHKPMRFSNIPQLQHQENTMQSGLKPYCTFTLKNHCTDTIAAAT